MLEVLENFFDQSGFMPHGHCYLWRPALLWLHAGSDTLIGLAYVSISLTLYWLVRKIRLPFSPMILAFGVFIGACGVTHFFDVWTLWIPSYWTSGGVRVITAIASVATGLYLFPVAPKVVAVARGAALAEERRLALETKNRELEVLYGKVKELDELRTRFFANVSHELRTPLALILGPAERALVDGRLPDDVRRELEVVHRNARLLLRQVNDLLDVARLDAGRLEPAWARIDLVPLCRSLASHFDALAAERRIRFEVELPASLPAEGDPDQLERVVLNLLSNAFKFTPEGGSVRIALDAGGDEARLAVEDGGPGIPAGRRQEVFERFRQLPDGDGARSAGSGLGLAIVRDLVALHHGSVHVEDAPGGGARFVARWPLRAPAGTTIAEPPVRPAAAGVAEAIDALHVPGGPELSAGDAASPGVLVVEDHAEMRTFVARTLGDHRVETAVDGAEGLEKAIALRPDLIVTDVMMPRMDGEELVRRLRGHRELGSTPILVLSARAEDELRIRLLRAGAQDYLVKPFSPEELVARARNLIAAKRARDVLAEAVATSHGGLESLAREVAGRKRELELALETARVARTQAERASQVKGEFLNLVSHELLTPMATMRMNVDAIRRDRLTPLPPRQRERVERISRSVDRLSNLIETLLEYTRIESGRLEVRPESFDLAELVAETADELLPQAQRKLLTLIHEPSPEAMPALRSDPRLVRLVLLNLGINAVKYTEHGSVRLRATFRGGAHRVSVSDTGPGIAPEDRARIFEPFEQLEPVRAKHTPGVGLGLALVREVIETLGGRIELDSEVGRGTTFTVVLYPLPDRDARPA